MVSPFSIFLENSVFVDAAAARPSRLVAIIVATDATMYSSNGE
jgi:hypothetical protein